MIKHNHSKLNMRIISIFLAAIILLEMIPANIVFAGDITDSQSKETIISEARESSEKEVADALETAGHEKIPTLEEYYAENGTPKVISLSEFIDEVGVYSTFDSSAASKYSDYKISIGTADELYLWSLNCNSIISQEKNFYLSANFVLGNNIEYNGGYYADEFNASYYTPVGTTNAPFNGTFDGQGFEIRKIAFDTYRTPDDPYGYGLFGVIGEQGTVQNLGLYGVSDMIVDGYSPIAVRLGMIAVINMGTINKVYCDLTELNGTDYSANCGFAGIAYENQGTVTNVYYAGEDYAEGESVFYHDPICAENSGKIQNAYYDKTIFTQPITGVSSEEASPVVAMTTVELKTLGKNDTDDGIEFANDTSEFYHWHILRKIVDAGAIATLTTAGNINRYFIYPKLYGFSSELFKYNSAAGMQNDLEISTPADLVYFPTSPESLFSNGNYRFVFHMTDNIDMSCVADGAYVPSSLFYGHFTGKTSDESQPNNCYSIINLRITKPGVATDGNGINYYYYGLIGRSNGTLIPDPDVEGQNLGNISNVNFIGGGIITGNYGFTKGYSSGTTQIYMGMAGGYDINGSVVNITSTADVIFSDETLAIKAYIGGIFGYVYCERLENIVNYGNVYGGTHKYVEGYNGNSSAIGGVAGYGITTINNSNIQRYHIKNVVNYGSVTGIGVYGSLSTDPERMQADHTDNNSAKYVNRAIYYYTGGVIGYSDRGLCIDMIANFGEVLDVPAEKKEVPVYDDKNNQVGTEMRYVGIVPDENSYILNYNPRLGGVTGYYLVSSSDNLQAHYGFDTVTEKFVSDTGFYERCYNFGDVTAVESRCGYVGGVRAHERYSANINQRNFGDVTCYSFNFTYGVGKYENGATYKDYDSANYGDIYVDNSSRSGRQTHFTNNRACFTTYGYGSGYTVRCNNYGDITLSFGGYVPWSYNVTTVNGVTYNDTYAVLGVSYNCYGCNNYGNIDVNTFDKWTGEYSYVDMTADHYLKAANGQELYTSYTSAWYGQSSRWLYISGVAADIADGCINYGNITVTGTPEDCGRVPATYDELVEMLGFSPNAKRRQEMEELKGENGTISSGSINGWEARTINGVSVAGTGLSSDIDVANCRQIYRALRVTGISNASSTTITVSNCVNLGDITVSNFAVDKYVNGISYQGKVSNCVNKSDITVNSDVGSSINVNGITQIAYNVTNCMNTGNLTVNSLNDTVYASGIIYELQQGTVFNVSDCINLGNIAVNRMGRQRKRIGGITTGVAGIVRYLRSDNESSLYGCSNYGDIDIKIDNKRYVSDDLDTTCDTVRLEYSNETNTTNLLYDRANDSTSAGGIIQYVSYSTGIAAHAINVNSCINQGNISVDAKQMYASSAYYAGGIAALFEPATANYGGDTCVLSNLVNHGDVTVNIEQEPYNANNAATSSNAGGVFGYLQGNSAGVNMPAIRSIVENVVNTGKVSGTSKKANGTASFYPVNVGGLAGRLYYSGNNDSNFTIKNVLSYSDNQLIGYQQGLTDWVFTADENGNGVALNNGNVTYSNRITLENLYSASTEHEIIKIGNPSSKDQSGNLIPQRQYSVGVLTTDKQKDSEKVSSDDSDLRAYKYIYPVAEENGAETSPAFFTRGDVDSDTGVVCAIGYLDYGALSTAYREKYSKLNSGKYDKSDMEEPDDASSPEYEEYLDWFKQLGGFVLTSAKPGANGSDYFPNQFIPSSVKPNGSVDIWYTDGIRTRLGTECAQIDLLDLNDILQFVVTNGETSTITKRFEKSETENTIFVYVQDEIASDALSVLSYQISSGAEVVFYNDPAHTSVIEDIYSKPIVMNKEYDSDGNEVLTYQLYARVTAQNGDKANWVIKLQSVSAEPSISVTSALITNSATESSSTNRTYYQNISEEASNSYNFWDYPAYQYNSLLNFHIETKNIEDGYNLYNRMSIYYYVQNAYGITEAGSALGLNKDSCLADLLKSDHSYTVDGNGNIRHNGVLVAELIYVGKDYNLVPETDGSYNLKAEKYNCVKPDNAPDDYYLKNESANIRWEFVKADGKTLISRSNADFFDENGALKLKCSYNSFGFVSTNTVHTNEEADINGNLVGSYQLYTGGIASETEGGYYELVFEFPNGSTQSVYIAIRKADSLKLAGYTDFGTTTLGSTAVLDITGQWSASESVREQKYDGYGAWASYEAAANAIEQAYSNGEDVPYAGRHTFAQYYNNVIFTENSNFTYEYYAGTGTNYLLSLYVRNSGDENTLKQMFHYRTSYSAVLFRPMIYKIHRRADGSVDYMDAIYQTMSEDLSVTRYYPVKIVFPGSSVDKTMVQYKTANDKFYSDPVSSVVNIDGAEQTVYEVPKGTESNFSMLSTYSTSPLSAPFAVFNFASSSSKPESNPTHNFDSLFTVEFCPEDGNEFTHIGNATFERGVGFRIITDKTSPAQVTATINRNNDTSVVMNLNGNATMGYYRITPIAARTEYFYLYEDAVKFAESLDAGVSIKGLDKSYEIVEEISDRGYPIYKTIMYMAYDSTIIHKRANDDSYLKNIYMSNEIGSTVNLSSINADVAWDSKNTYALAESNQNLESHISLKGKSNIIRFSDGKITYSADPLTDSTDTCIENVNSFVVYCYIMTNRRINGVQTSISDAYLDMKKDYIPANSALYYLDGAELDADGDIIDGTGEWVQVEFDSNRQVIDSHKHFFRYEHFADENDVKEAKMFKVVAENGNVSYYTINALQNKRNKSINVRVGDFVRNGLSIAESDNGTQKNLSELLETYGTFGVSIRCMVDSSATTMQTGYYSETGIDGNNFYNLKFGNYDIILNVPESSDYEYDVYYFGSGNKVELERSPDNPNAYRLPLRFKNLTGEANSIELCVSVKKKEQADWGYVIHNVFTKTLKSLL